jgi:hypothetical protein
MRISISPLVVSECDQEIVIRISKDRLIGETFEDAIDNKAKWAKDVIHSLKTNSEYRCKEECPFSCNECVKEILCNLLNKKQNAS